MRLLIVHLESTHNVFIKEKGIEVFFLRLRPFECQQMSIDEINSKKFELQAIEVE